MTMKREIYTHFRLTSVHVCLSTESGEREIADLVKMMMVMKMLMGIMTMILLMMI